MEALGAQACDAIRDDKALPQTSTYLKAHSRACTVLDFYCVMDSKNLLIGRLSIAQMSDRISFGAG